MIDLDTDWSTIDFSDPKRSAKEPEKGACPKCGKKLGKGGHFHIKACDGQHQPETR